MDSGTCLGDGLPPGVHRVIGSGGRGNGSGRVCGCRRSGRGRGRGGVRHKAVVVVAMEIHGD